MRRFFIAFCLLLVMPVTLSLANSSIVIDGLSYVSLQDYLEGKNLQYQWDPFLKNGTLTAGERFIRFHVGSEYFLSEGKVIKLEGKTRSLNGSVFLPAGARAYLEKLKPAGSSARTQTPPVIPRHGIHRIVIDAGHGGQDHGAISPRGTKEKDLVLDVAKAVRDELERRGIEVILTRSDDVFISLSRRAAIANEKKADFFVSIHANASPRRSLKGFEIYYLSEAVDDAALALERAENSAAGEEETAAWSRPTKALRAVLWDLKETENRKESIRIAQAMLDGAEVSMIAPRRLRSAQFYVLKWTECPAVLVELGYLTNRGEEKRLKSLIGRRRVTQAMVDGLLKYKETFERTNGFTQ